MGAGGPGIVATSYPSDEGLLAELREAWPPPVGDPADARGYAIAGLAGTTLRAAVRLGGRNAVALTLVGDGSFEVVPLVLDDVLVTSWRVARPGDGLSAFVAGVPAASERAIAADQTNTSVVVGERAIVKWFRRIGPGPSRAAPLVAHLDAVGFRGIPPPLGSISWRSPAGIELALAQGDGFLPDARDGWEWIVERLAAHARHILAGAVDCPADCDPWVGRPLGSLVAGLHAALATPSRVIAVPRMEAAPDDVAAWRDRARATLADAIALTAADDANDGSVLARLEPGLRATIERLVVGRTVATQPVHGDLHVGQVLEWSGGLAVIDFDGNPALDATANALRQPVERDLAQMLSSLDHVGRVVAHQKADATGPGGATPAVLDAIEGWIVRTRREFLAAAGGAPDPALIAAFEVEQECRELVYAARFLKRWRYAPMATLRARYVS